MRVLLVYLNNYSQYSLPQGAAVLAAIIRQKHKLSVIDTTDFFPEEAKKRLIQEMENFQPNLVLFSSVSGVFKYGLDLADEIKKRFKEQPFLVIFGGVHPTISPEEVISHNSIDAICIGEGDLAIRELLDKLEKKEDYFNTRNFWFKQKEKIIKNPLRPLIISLDSLPFPAREMFSQNHDKTNTGISIMAARGCPFACPFCINEYLNKLYPKHSAKVRFKTVDYLLKEIRWAYKQTGVKQIYFVDDNLLANEKWLKEFSEKFPVAEGFSFACLSSVKLINEKKLALLKKSGCNGLIIGIESGDEEVRNKILKKNLKNEEILKTFSLVKKYEIRACALYMIGVPFETKKSLRNTLEFNKQLYPDNTNVAIFVPFKKTSLRKVAIENGFLEEGVDEPKTFYSDTTLHFPDLTAKDITKAHLLMEIYQRHSKVAYHFYSILYNCLACFHKERHLIYLIKPKYFLKKVFRVLNSLHQSKKPMPLKSEMFTKKYFFNSSYDYGGKDFIESKGTKLPERLVKIYNLQKLNPHKAYSILDVGCGKGELAIYNALQNKNVKINAVDYSKDAIEIASENLKHHESLLKRVSFELGDITCLDFADNRFDIIFITDVLEHLTPQQVKMGLEGVKRVLKQDGELIIHTAPNKLFFNFGYRIQCFFLKQKGILLPKNPRTGVNAMYINEPTYFKFKKSLNKAGFNGKIYFPKPNSSARGIKKALFKLVYEFFPLKIFFAPTLYCKVRKIK